MDLGFVSAAHRFGCGRSPQPATAPAWATPAAAPAAAVARLARVPSVAPGPGGLGPVEANAWDEWKGQTWRSQMFKLCS